MLDEKEIISEILRLENTPSSYSNYAKLATLYTIRDRLDSPSEHRRDIGHYEYSAAASSLSAAESDFLRLVIKKDSSGAWAIMDELMESLQVVNPRVYDSVMRKLDRLN